MNVKVKGYELLLDIFKKPTDSFNYLDYRSCHPSHTRNNIALSLARRIIWITSGDPQPRLAELKDNLVRRKHPPAKVDKAFAKVFTHKSMTSRVIPLCSRVRIIHHSGLTGNRLRSIRQPTQRLHEEDLQRLSCSHWDTTAQSSPSSFNQVNIFKIQNCDSKEVTRFVPM